MKPSEPMVTLPVRIAKRLIGVYASAGMMPAKAVEALARAMEREAAEGASPQGRLNFEDGKR